MTPKELDYHILMILFQHGSKGFALPNYELFRISKLTLNDFLITQNRLISKKLVIDDNFSTRLLNEGLKFVLTQKNSKPMAQNKPLITSKFSQELYIPNIDLWKKNKLEESLQKSDPIN